MYITRIRQSNDGGYIATGSTVYIHKRYDDGEDSYTEGFVLKTDKNGKQVWLEKYGYDYSDGYGFEDKRLLAPVAGGGYVIVGRGEISQQYVDFETFIAKIPETPITIKSIPRQAYTGKNIYPNPVINIGSKTLVKDKDYKVTFKSNKDVGEAEATIVGMGNYCGERIIYFYVVPKKITIKTLAVAKKQLSIKWKRTPAAQGIDGYEIRYKKIGANKWSLLEVEEWKKQITSTKIKGLAKGKKYKVQIRSYKGFDYCLGYGEVTYTLYSAWSKVKTSSKVK